MSIRIMTQVWDNGPNDKAETLVLLALADFCNDSGECWPSMATIATKSRMTERGAQKIVARLVESGWLEIDARKGRSGTNLYTVKTPNPVHPEPHSPPNPVRQNPERRSENPEPRSPKPLEPSIEPSFKEAKASLSLVSNDGLSETDQAIDLFKAAARESGWPVPRVLTKARQSALSKRLKECGGIEGWKIALEKAQASNHCCGQNSRGWTLTFDFITTQSSFAKLMEGNYDNRPNNGSGGSLRQAQPADANATARAISTAARARRTPTSDCF